MHFREILIAAVALAIGAPASANFTANEVKEDLESENSEVRDLAHIIVDSTAEGIFWTNVAGSVRFGVWNYCAPEKLAVSAQQYRHIFLQFLRANPELGEKPFTMVMYSALVDVFPCEGEG